MSAQTNREHVSLLFTPRTGDKQGLPDYRSQRQARSPSTPGYGSYARTVSYKDGGGSTPRRRSLTPTTSFKDRQHQEPPAPPTQSLLESPAGASASGWVLQPEQVGGAAGVGSALALAQQTDRRGGAGALRESHFPEVQETWVTVFGFQSGDQALIMQEFAKCGEVLFFGSGRDDTVNWVHIQYANKYQAQRALQHNGELVCARIMIGVKPLDARHHAAVDAAASSSGGAVVRQARAAMQALPLRPYRVETNISQEALPQPKRTAWEKGVNPNTY